MRTVIVFDVTDDRRRYELVKVLRAFGQRVQFSVFEAADLTANAYLRMRSAAEGAIDLQRDSLRYYRLCAACVGRIEASGVSRYPEPDPTPYRIFASFRAPLSALPATPERWPLPLFDIPCHGPEAAHLASVRGVAPPVVMAATSAKSCGFSSPGRCPVATPCAK
jgi:CRISPR-associated protein Cas2